MSKTYTLTSTAKYTGFKMAGYWNATWSNVEYGSSINTNYNGYVCHSTDSGLTHFTSIFFNSSTLATLRTKTVTSITLTIYFSATDNTGIVVRLKSNSTTSDFTTPGSNIASATANSSSKSWTLTSSGVPQYGYVVGPSATNSTMNDWVRISSATLVVVTNETDYSYTLAYNANGGSGAPSNQTGSNTQASPSYTFTISNTLPTRNGYIFLGWSINSSATTADYVPGGTITVTSSGTTTLYAVWQAATQTYTFNLTRQGVQHHSSTFWPANPNFNATYTSAAAGLSRDTSYWNGYSYVTEYFEYGTFLLGDMSSVSGTVTSISLTVNFNASDYRKQVAIGKKTNASSSNYAYTYLTTSPQFDNGATTFTVDLTSYGLCPYGYLIWQNDQNQQYAMNPIYITSAVLTIVTSTANNIYILVYNPNGGADGPSGQIGYGATNSSYNFTVSSTAPTRPNFTFLGWSTSADAITSSYSGGDTFTATSTGTSTLYAVWRFNVSIRVVNAAGSGFNKYLVAIVNDTGTELEYYIPYVVNSTGTDIEEYSG